MMSDVCWPKYFFAKDDLTALCSKASHGNMALASGELGKANRRAFLSEFIPKEAVVALTGNVHGSKVVLVGGVKKRENVIPETDALITNIPGVYLATTFADCPPVMFYDPVRRAVAIAHSGYKGIVGEIVPSVIEEMFDMGSEPGDILVEIGPSICGDHCQFGSEASDVFFEYRGYILKKNGNGAYLVDLRAMIWEQLRLGGVPRKNIRFCDICTYEADDFFSDRRKKSLDEKEGAPLEAGIALIGLDDIVKSEPAKKENRQYCLFN